MLIFLYNFYKSLQIFRFLSTLTVFFSLFTIGQELYSGSLAVYVRGIYNYWGTFAFWLILFSLLIAVLVLPRLCLYYLNELSKKYSLDTKNMFTFAIIGNLIFISSVWLFICFSNFFLSDNYKSDTIIENNNFSIRKYYNKFNEFMSTLNPKTQEIAAKEDIANNSNSFYEKLTMLSNSISTEKHNLYHSMEQLREVPNNWPNYISNILTKNVFTDFVATNGIPITSILQGAIGIFVLGSIYTLFSQQEALLKVAERIVHLDTKLAETIGTTQKPIQSLIEFLDTQNKSKIDTAADNFFIQVGQVLSTGIKQTTSAFSENGYRLFGFFKNPETATELNSMSPLVIELKSALKQFSDAVDPETVNMWGHICVQLVDELIRLNILL